jgi:hypothetical protein
MLAKPPSTTSPQLFNAQPPILRHLLNDGPLCGREKDDGERRGVFQRVEEGPGGGVIREEVFVDALTETEDVG